VSEPIKGIKGIDAARSDTRVRNNDEDTKPYAYCAYIPLFAQRIAANPKTIKLCIKIVAAPLSVAIIGCSFSKVARSNSTCATTTCGTLACCGT
jgi:hypothetical protein